LALLAGLTANLAWQSAAAQIPSSLLSRPVTNLIVPIAGTVEGVGETVALSGRARVIATVVPDPDFGGPTSVLLSIDLLNVAGVGQSSGARYVATGEQKLLRLLSSSDVVEVTFPVAPVGAKGTASVRPLVASFNLSFDTGNGQLRRALASLSAPDLPRP
ncbi:MAG: hypothetical protein HYU75_03675, partial [Betaproteobacteria bacterium]|nr:hypothetical protein [Betaproteobacteria bacterium]